MKLTKILCSTIILASIMTSCITLNEMSERTNVPRAEMDRIPLGSSKIIINSDYTGEELFDKVNNILFESNYIIYNANKDPYFIHTGSQSDGNTKYRVNINISDSIIAIYPQYLQPKVYSGGMSMGSGNFEKAKWYNTSTIYSYAFLFGVSLAFDIANEINGEIRYEAF